MLVPRANCFRAPTCTNWGVMLGALTMDAIETWAARPLEEIDLGAVLRFRFAVVVDQFRSQRKHPPAP